MNDEFTNFVKSRQKACAVLGLRSFNWGGRSFRFFLHWLQLPLNTKGINSYTSLYRKFAKFDLQRPLHIMNPNRRQHNLR